MRVALLGNTCNNNSAFLRYLLDLGIDAHLFLYSNEGKENSNPIHSPLWDSFSSDRLKETISYLDIPNGLVSVIEDQISLNYLLALNHSLMLFLDMTILCWFWAHPCYFPTFKKKRLDIFYPYSIVNFVNGLEN